MPVGIGFGRGEPLRSGVRLHARFAAPRGFHPGALWLAVAAPLLAIAVLIARIAA